MKPYDESYVHELLKALPKGLTLDQFMERCRPDIYGGWKHEVREAGRRYFGRARARERKVSNKVSNIRENGV